MPVIKESNYESPYILSNQHMATLLPNFLRWVPSVKYSEETIELEDGDFLELNWSRVGSNRVAVVTHGLGGDSSKPYVKGMVRALNRAGWDTIAWNLRGSGKQLNRLPRFYHGGDTPDLEAVIQHGLKTGNYRHLALVGFSLGGNITARYIGEKGDKAPSELVGSILVSAPVDLKGSADHLSTGARAYYMKFFVAGYKKKLKAKHKLMPDLLDITGIDKIKTFREFDSRYNTKWYGFKTADEFYRETSANQVLHNIKSPALFLSAWNDPFLPENCYPVEAAEKNKHIFLEAPEMGGHVGFFSFRKWGSYWHEDRSIEFLKMFSDDF